MRTASLKRFVLLIATALALASVPASAQWPSWGSGGGGGAFTGGTLTAPLVLDATNTLCSQALSLSFSGDADTGIQRLATNIIMLCAGGGLGPYVEANGASGSTRFVHRPITTGATGDLLQLGSSGTLLFRVSSAGLPNFQGLSVGFHGLAVDVTTTGNEDFTINAAGTGRTEFEDVLVSNVGVPSAVDSGTCTNEALVTGDDTSGEVEGDCTAGQTIVVTFSAARTTAPSCVCSPRNAAAGAATALQFCSASTTALTITSVGAMTDGQVSYWCIENP